jgi:hypothetical protein
MTTSGGTKTNTDIALDPRKTEPVTRRNKIKDPEKG